MRGSSRPCGPPTGEKRVVAVAATDMNDNRASFSSYGTWVALAAPGVSILSTNWLGTYEQLSGTSMAAPHVSALAGLVLASGQATDAQGVVNRMTASADRLPGTGQLWQFGRINAAAALGAPPTTPTPTLAPSNIRGWGTNNWGALAVPVATLQVVDPSSLHGPGAVVSVAAGNGFNLGLKADGTVWAWGYDQNAQLAVIEPSCYPGATLVVLCSTTPVQVPGLSGVTAIAAAGAALALRSDGTVWTWGGVDSGQLCVWCMSPIRALRCCVESTNGRARLSGSTATATPTGRTAHQLCPTTVCTWRRLVPTSIRSIAQPDN
jgi:hypothetical protein